MKKAIFLFLLLVLSVSIASAVDDMYKPYLHKANVPEHPKLDLYGRYQTNLFPGSATYVYNIVVPKGTNGLTPEISLSYNSQSRNSMLGNGWALSQSFIFRDINGTFNDISDDDFKLVLSGSAYRIVYINGTYYSNPSAYLKIEKLVTSTNSYGEYWLVTSKDGTSYRFGYNPDSEQTSNLGFSYTTRWSLDQVEDTHGNKIYYSYLENPFAEDFGAVYLSEISYNNDKKRKIIFGYEPAERLDKRISYSNGNKIYESRRLNRISVYAEGNLVRSYNLSYSYLNKINSISSLSKITFYGSDNSSVLGNVSFEYYNMTEGYSSSIYSSPILFSDSTHADFGVRLVDVNNDGFADIVKGRSSTSEKSVYLNNKISNWTSSNYSLPVYIAGASDYDNGIRFADVNNDGLIDILQAKDSTRIAWLNNGTGWVNSSWIIPVDFIIGTTDNGVQIADLNGDGKIDLVQGKNTVFNAWLNNGTGWINVTPLFTSPKPFVTDGGLDIGTRLEDVNGDGLPDVLSATDYGSPNKVTYINNGTGWVYYSGYDLPVYFSTSFKTDYGVRFADINGDGLPDMMEDYYNSSASVRGYWLNTGSGWQEFNCSDSECPEYFTKDGLNVGRRLSDVNADGFADIVVSNNNGTGNEIRTQIRNASSAYLLKKIRNEYGGITEIDYSASTSADNSLNGTSQLGFNLWIVDDYKRNNSLSGEFADAGTYSYSYLGGRYDYKNRDFRGFSKVTEIQPDYDYIVHYFKQDDALKGKEYKTEVYGSYGNLYSKTENTYNYTSDGYYVVNLKDTASYLYDGDSTPKITNVSYSYDGYGNVISKISWGDSSVSSDEKYEYYNYGYNNVSYIVNKPINYELYSSDNITLAKKTRYFYDGLGYGSIGKGDLTKTQEWNDNGADIVREFEFDSYGNVVKSVDGLGFETKYRYGLRDTTFTYADKVTNALNQYTDYKYDLGTGNLLWSEKEGIRTSYVYDTFGRITKEIQPYDNEQLPTKKYTYYIDGIAPEIIKVSQRESAGNYTDALFYYDGFGNAVQIKNIIENNKTVTKNIFYDSQDRVKYEQNPYFENYSFSISTPLTSVNKTFYTYDSMDRVTKVTNPDGTIKNTAFNKWTISDYDGNGHQHDYLLDSYGRIKNVLEYNIQPLLNNRTETYNTSYFYDANDNLIKIVDNEGNEFKFFFDSLGRKTKLDDPDLGVWTYTYDANSNLITQTDNRGNNIILSYDALNRVAQKNSTGNYIVNISFYYDSQYWGTLSNISMNGYSIRYTYDKRMRLIKEEQYLNTQWIPVTTSYDSANKIIETNALNRDIELYYNKISKVNKINNYITSANYNSFGSLLNKTYNNGLTSTFNYNSTNNRLTQIATGNIQNLAYGYDNVGNIISLRDSVQSRNYSMTYDGLDRLASTTINNDLYQYEWSSIGNLRRIISNTLSKRLNYNSKLPHAPSEVIESTAGAGIYSAKDLDLGTRNRTFEFFIVKERTTNISNVNWSMNFGQNSINSVIPINLSVPVLVIVENNYSNGGTYTLNVSTPFDANKFIDKWGTDAQSLNFLTSNRSLSYLEFWINKDISEKSLNAFWNCSNIANSTIQFNISNNTMVIIEYNYSAPGNKNVVCSVSSSDGIGNKSVDFEMKGLKVENYTITSLDTNLKQVSFRIKNYWNPLIANWQISSDSNIYNTSNLTVSDADTIVRIINLTSDGYKTVYVNVSSNGVKGNFTDNFRIKALEINNYDRYEFNNTNRVLMFEVQNKWPANLSVNWNISDPNVKNGSYLVKNKSIIVIIEENYTNQSRHEPQINAYSNSFLSTFRDRFNIFIVHLLDMQILKQSISSTVTELTTRSHSGNKSLTWKYDTGQIVINSTLSVYVNESKDIMIIIESNYSTVGVYSVNASINSSTYNDNTQRVVQT